MANINVTSTPGGGAQDSTQDPQSAGNSAGSGAPVSSVQPGATGSLDNTTGGVPLGNSQVLTVPLPAATSTVVKAEPARHSNSPVSVGVAGVLFVVALALIISIFLPAKNTTE